MAVRDLTVAYREKPVLWDIDLEIPSGKLAAIIGPNGAGKSTLIKSALGLIPAAAGTVKFFGQPYRSVRKRVAYVPQRSSVDWNFPTNAVDVVLMGTYGKLGWIRRPGKSEREYAQHCLELVGMSDFAKRQISQLSGGQQQRVFLARALAQRAEIYLMDEPFAGVDATTERAIVDILQTLRNEGKTVVCVHHDLETAPEYFDWLVLLNVRVIGSGTFDETFTRERLQATYGGRIGTLSDRLVFVGAA
jgi:manganese/zinc/iron transport system ATP- binding protein